MAGNRQRIAVAVLALSAAGFSAWNTSEGDGPTTVQPGVGKVHHPYIPTKGDVPTIGHGSTRYENGTLVKLSDKPITPQRAEQLARNLMAEDEKVFRASITGVELFQEEYDLYLDFFGQYGSGNWRSSTSRRELLAGNYPQACQALLKFRFQGGRDCSLPQNWGPKGCKGVWTRQQKRVAQCMAVQVAQ